MSYAWVASYAATIADVMSPSGDVSSVMPTLWSSRHTHAAAAIPPADSGTHR